MDWRAGLAALIGLVGGAAIIATPIVVLVLGCWAIYVLDGWLRQRPKAIYWTAEFALTAVVLFSTFTAWRVVQSLVELISPSR